MRRLFLACIAIALVLLALPLIAVDSPARAQTPPSPTPPPPTTPDQEALRQQLGTFFNGLQDVVNTMKANPQMAAMLSATGTDPTASIANAQQQLPQLTSTDLGALQNALAPDPNWQQFPAALKSAVLTGGHASAAPTRSLPGTTLLANHTAPATRPAAPRAPSVAFMQSFNGQPSAASRQAALASFDPFRSNSTATLDTTVGDFIDNCESIGNAPNFGNGNDFTAMQVANTVQSSLNAVQMATPGVFALPPAEDVPTVVKTVEAIAWGVANAAYNALQQTEAIALDCAVSYFLANQENTWPTDGTNADPPNFVATSSQASIDALYQHAQNSSTTITQANTTANTVKTQSATLATAATALNSTLTDVDSRVTEAQSDLQSLQTDVGALKATETLILSKANQAISNLTVLQQLQLQMEIEANLSLHGNNPVGLFETPQSHGGYIEVVGSVVNSTITRETATGKGVGNAASYYQQATAAYQAGQFKSAYSLYSKAYQDATK